MPNTITLKGVFSESIELFKKYWKTLIAATVVFMVIDIAIVLLLEWNNLDDPTITNPFSKLFTHIFQFVFDLGFVNMILSICKGRYTKLSLDYWKLSFRNVYLRSLGAVIEVGFLFLLIVAIFLPIFFLGFLVYKVSQLIGICFVILVSIAFIVVFSYWEARFQFIILSILDKDKSCESSISYSREITKPQVWLLAGILVIGTLIELCGLFMCLVGFIPAYALCNIIPVVAYLQLTKEPETEVLEVLSAE